MQRELKNKLQFALENAAHDALTGLFNRRYFERRLREESAHARRHKRPFAIVMLDLDHFKLVNDTYGHEDGDRVLRHVAEVARRQLREDDVAVSLRRRGVRSPPPRRRPASRRASSRIACGPALAEKPHRARPEGRAASRHVQRRRRGGGRPQRLQRRRHRGRADPRSTAPSARAAIASKRARVENGERRTPGSRSVCLASRGRS